MQARRPYLGLRAFVLTACCAPLLLAPVRFQQNGEEILLTPTTAPVGGRGTPAIALPSPTVIEVSPTRAPLPPVPEAAQAASATQPVPPVPATRPATPAPTQPAGGITPMQAAVCVRALDVVIDIAALSMRQSGRENLLDLTIAATMAQMQVANRQWPVLRPLRQAPIPFFTPNRAELRQAVGYATTFCTSPNARDERPTVERPR